MDTWKIKRRMRMRELRDPRYRKKLLTRRTARWKRREAALERIDEYVKLDNPRDVMEAYQWARDLVFGPGEPLDWDLDD